MPILSIILVSFNTERFLISCLDSLVVFNKEKLKSGEYEVIIVDNNSFDTSVAKAATYKKHIQKITIIENEKNEGFSKANNIGIKKAKGTYILFLNTDTLVEKNTLANMIAFMENNPTVGIATCKVVLPDATLDDAAHRGFPTPWNSLCYFSGLAKLFSTVPLFTGYTLTWMDLSLSHEIDACAGAFMMVRRDAGDQIGWWDESYFFYGEDLDFCFRIKHAGWKVFYVPFVSILHYKGVSGGIKKISQQQTTATPATKILATKARFDAMKIFYTKHYHKKYPALLRWVVFMMIDIKYWHKRRNV